MITFANQEIPRSPFEVNVGPVKNSNIKAYGPGLKSGIVNKPARSPLILVERQVL
jgi:filamin